MEHLINLEGTVLGFCMKNNHIDCLCKKKLQKVDKVSGKVIYEKEIFEKEGLAKILLADKKQIFISDFCSLYILEEEDYEIVGKWKIGENLSSDICGMAVDEKRIYCSIRNGKLITVDRASFVQKEYSVSSSSEIALWNKSTLEKSKEMEVPLSLSGNAYIEENKLYIASRNICGIDCVYLAGC